MSPKDVDGSYCFDHTYALVAEDDPFLESFQ